MTDVTPIGRAARRAQMKTEAQAAKDREAWWRNGVKAPLHEVLDASLENIRKQDPTFEARMLAGHTVNLSLHVISPEGMAELERQAAVEAEPEAVPTGLLDASGEPIVR